jgi:hypothetical protein
MLVVVVLPQRTSAQNARPMARAEFDALLKRVNNAGRFHEILNTE